MDMEEVGSASDKWIKAEVLEKLLRYVKVDTQSDENSSSCPSTQKQFDLARMLSKELQELGARDVQVDSHCYVTATLPATTGAAAPVIGLLAHLDTSPDVSGSGVTPRIIENYQGGDIVLDAASGVIIRESENPELARARGHTIVTADGSTLLGADDKAGIAAIMTAAEYISDRPEHSHGPIKIAFTPDEEIGRGVELFDIERFGADFAYTIDGGFTGELNDETFSADAVTVSIVGRDMHPGTAKDRMVNSIRAMAEFIARLPRAMAPERTCDREAYIHPQTFSGCVGNSTVKLLLRDFSDEGLSRQKALIEEAINEAQSLFPEARFNIAVSPTYRNMRPILLEYPDVLGRLERAVAKTNLTPFWKPIRGGTDGAVLTSRRLPTPNIFTGSCNSHSLTEWQDLDGLVKVVETIVNLIAV